MDLNKSMKKKKALSLNGIRFTLLFLLMALMTFSYHPAIIDVSRAADQSSGTVLSNLVLVSFLALSLLCLSFSSLKIRFIGNYLYLLLLVIIVAIAVYAIFSNKIIFNTTRDIIMSFLAIMIGWRLKFNENRVVAVLFVYSIFVIFNGLMQVLTNVGGFVVVEQYVTDAKNSLGAMLGTAIVAMIIVWRNAEKHLSQWAAIVFALFGLIIILTIRARGALLAAMVVGLIVFFNSTKRKNGVLVVAIVTCLILVLFPIMPDFIYNYVYDSLFSGSQEYDVSSGRLRVYRYAIDTLIQGNNIWLGNIRLNFERDPWIHNYALLQLYRYGILFSLPLLALFLYLLFYMVKKTIKTKNQLIECGFPLVLVLLVISFFEPTFPYSPGTATLFNYILLGSSLNINY